MVDEGCSGIINDGYAFATLMNVNNTNAYFPNCQVVNGSVLNADISAEGNPANVLAGAGRDSWYRFVAPATAARIRVVPTGFNAVIELRTAAHPTGQVDVENANSAVGGVEIMNVSGLTIGQTYYLAVRNYDATAGGTFTLCVSPLMPSGCGTTQPVGGLSLCSSFKALFRGATSYTFSFTGTGGAAPTPFATTSATSSGLLILSNGALALRNGGIYSVRVDANYTLPNGVGVSDPTITIQGTACSRTIAAAPLMEVMSTQRCTSATLARSTFLRAVTTTGQSNACSATGYNFRFTRVADCAGTAIPGETSFVVSSTTTYLALGNPFPNSLYPLPNLGYWKVEIAPIFTYGATAYGPARIIQVNNTGASMMLPETAEADERSEEVDQTMDAELFPNPGNGDLVTLAVKSDFDARYLTVTDQLGRTITSFTSTVQAGEYVQIRFDNTLAAGVYFISLFEGDDRVVKRWVVN
jgi:hypothetical protein